MIDSDGFRPNIGIVICNRVGQLLWAKRAGESGWQFPQGGIKKRETLEQALIHKEKIIGITLGKKVTISGKRARINNKVI